MKRTMRHLIVWMLLVMLLCLTGCGGMLGGSHESDPLSFWQGPITLEGILSVGESEYQITLSSPDGKNGTVTFNAPESMKGYVFEKSDDGFYLSYKDLRVPLSTGTLPGGAGALFSLIGSDFSQVKTSEETANGIALKVYTVSIGADGSLRLYIKKDGGNPLRIEFDSQAGSGVFHIQKAQY